MSAAEATTFMVVQLNAAITALGEPPAAVDPSAPDALSVAWDQFITRVGTIIPNSLGAGGAELPVYADNAAALAGGLSIGQFYRITATDGVAQVHA